MASRLDGQSFPLCRREASSVSDLRWKGTSAGQSLAFCRGSLLFWVWAWVFLVIGQVLAGEWIEAHPSPKATGSAQAADGLHAISYSLFLDPGWEKAAKEKPLVISLPGLGSTGTPIEKILRLARKEGFAYGRFEFPYEPIQHTAYRLAQALQDIRRKAPQRRVALVSYSLGGLIGRAVIEDPELDPGNVRALIMLCPPNHGSLLLQLLPWRDSDSTAWAVEGSSALENGLTKLVPSSDPPTSSYPAFPAGPSASPASPSASAGGPSASPAGQVISSTAQAASAKRRAEGEGHLTGLAAVWADLRPGSAFLQRLNSRPRNPKVRYTILLGDRAYLGSDDRESLQKWAAQLPGAQQATGATSFWQVISQLDELVHGRGDGAVAIRRGRLEGVQDVHIFHFSHLGILCSEWESPEGRRAQELILDRLRTCPQ